MCRLRYLIAESYVHHLLYIYIKPTVIGPIKLQEILVRLCVSFGKRSLRASREGTPSSVATRNKKTS